MVVNLRYLAFVPTYRHHLEPVILIYQIASVEFITPEKVTRYRIDIDRIVREKLIDVVASEHIVPERP